MFMGTYNHTMDSKGRVSMPARFRDDLGSSFVITRGLEECLFVFNQEEWETVDRQIRSMPWTAKQARAFSRQFYSWASELTLDRQGRILIPAGLRTLADIEKDVTIIGVSNRIEIWSKEKWDAYSDMDEQDYETLAGQLDGFGM